MTSNLGAHVEAVTGNKEMTPIFSRDLGPRIVAVLKCLDELNRAKDGGLGMRWATGPALNRVRAP